MFFMSSSTRGELQTNLFLHCLGVGPCAALDFRDRRFWLIRGYGQFASAGAGSAVAVVARSVVRAGFESACSAATAARAIKGAALV